MAEYKSFFIADPATAQALTSSTTASLFRTISSVAQTSTSTTTTSVEQLAHSTSTATFTFDGVSTMASSAQQTAQTVASAATDNLIKALTETLIDGKPFPGFHLWKPLLSGLALIGATTTLAWGCHWYKNGSKVNMVIFHLIRTIERNEKLKKMMLEDKNELVRWIRAEVADFVQRHELNQDGGKEVMKTMKRKMYNGDIEGRVKRTKLGGRIAEAPVSGQHEVPAHNQREMVSKPRQEDKSSQDGDASMHDGLSVTSSSSTSLRPIPRFGTRVAQGKIVSQVPPVTNSRANQGASPTSAITRSNAKSAQRVSPDSSSHSIPSPKPYAPSKEGYGFRYSPPSYSNSSASSSSSIPKSTLVSRAMFDAFGGKIDPISPNYVANPSGYGLRYSPSSSSSPTPSASSSSSRPKSTLVSRATFDAFGGHIDPISPNYVTDHTDFEKYPPRSKLSTPPNVITEKYGVHTGKDLSPVEEGSSVASSVDEEKTHYRVTRGPHSPNKLAQRKSIKDCFQKDKTRIGPVAVKHQIPQEESEEDSGNEDHSENEEESGNQEDSENESPVDSVHGLDEDDDTSASELSFSGAGAVDGGKSLELSMGTVKQTEEEEHQVEVPAESDEQTDGQWDDPIVDWDPSTEEEEQQVEMPDEDYSNDEGEETYKGLDEELEEPVPEHEVDADLPRNEDGHGYSGSKETVILSEDDSTNVSAQSSRQQTPEYSSSSSSISQQSSRPASTHTPRLPQNEASVSSRTRSGTPPQPRSLPEDILVIAATSVSPNPTPPRRKPGRPRKADKEKLTSMPEQGDRPKEEEATTTPQPTKRGRPKKAQEVAPPTASQKKVRQTKGMNATPVLNGKRNSVLPTETPSMQSARIANKNKGLNT